LSRKLADKNKQKRRRKVVAPERGDEGLGFHRGNREDHKKIRRRGRSDVDRELMLLSCLLWEENKQRTGWRDQAKDGLVTGKSGLLA
jgi:hypothetical protein